MQFSRYMLIILKCFAETPKQSFSVTDILRISFYVFTDNLTQVNLVRFLLNRIGCTDHYQMENTRFELVTSCLQGRRSPNWANPPYSFIRHLPMGLSGLEPPTSRLSGVRSNRLSYKPIFKRVQCLFFLFLDLAATYSPTSSPMQYHRPLRS